jgi:hypothetical protein
MRNENYDDNSFIDTIKSAIKEAMKDVFEKIYKDIAKGIENHEKRRSECEPIRKHIESCGGFLSFIVYKSDIPPLK